MSTIERWKIKMRRIRLHLDISDYGIMYRAPAGTPEARVRDDLIEMKERGRIEIGLSYGLPVRAGSGSGCLRG